jgi:hypothetical protein
VIAAAGGAAIGEAVTFSSAPSSDPDPGDSLTSHWSIAGVPADGPEQSRSFPSAGPVSVTLTVTDLSGHSATASKTIDITAPPVANPPVQAGGPDGPPLVSRFAISRKRFAAGRRAAFSFKLSEDARVRIVVTRSHQLLRRSRRAGALVRAGHSGPNEVRFSGRIGKRSLKPGRYVATLRATDLAGRVSAGRTVAFTILR